MAWIDFKLPQMAPAPLRFPAASLILEGLFYRPAARILIILLASCAALLGICVPWMQRHFIDNLAKPQQALLWLGTAFLATLVAQTFSYTFRILAAKEGLIFGKNLAAKIYIHALNLHPTARQERTVGDIITYYTQDVSTAASFIEELIPLILAVVLPLAIAPPALFIFFRVPIFAVLVLLCANISLSFALGVRQGRFFQLNKRNAQHRLSLVNEWLQNMRIIRVLGWEFSFEQRIQEKRLVESADRLKMVTNGSTMNSLNQTAPFVLNVVTVLALLHSRNGHVSAGEVFGILWVFGVFLARPLRMLPFVLVTTVDVITSAHRLRSFLRLPQEQMPCITTGTPEESHTVISVRGLNLQLKNRTILHNINFDIQEGEFIAVIGTVGAGKSALLSSLTGQLQATFASYRVFNKDVSSMTLSELRAYFASTPQEPFIMSATLGENVLLEYGQQYSTDPQIALDVAQFPADPYLFPNGLATEIGERGVNLSGGQRQRVNLARCVYASRPILLLDDVLSAVDADTEAKLLDKLLRGAWSQHTRILTTHRMSVLPYTDRILIIEDGCIVESGTFAVLSQNSPRFLALQAQQ